ncbi:MAG: ABC transporter permease [Vicinamibacterales bacterium]
MGSPLRLLRRTPVATSAAIVMSAVAIAIATLALATFDASRWRPLPFADSGNVVVVYARHEGPQSTRQQVNWSYTRGQSLVTQATTLELAGLWRPASVTMTERGLPSVVDGEFVSADYFTLLRIAPIAGRVFSGEEATAAHPAPVAVVSEGFVERRARMGDVISVGTRLRLNGEVVDVIGITPRAFRGLTGNADVWMPVPMAAVLTYPEFLTTNQDFIPLLARRRVGVTEEALQREVDALTRASYAANPADIPPDVIASGYAVPLAEAVARPEAQRASALILGGGVLLFGLALANLAALHISRALARRRESAVTLAMGAGPWRLWRGLAAEPMMTLAVGGVLGLGLAGAVLNRVDSFDPLGGLGRSMFATFSAVTFDLRLIGAWWLATLVAIVCAAAVPAAWAARRASLDDLHHSSRGSTHTGLSWRRPGTPALIIGVEAALAVVLVIAAAQLLDSYRRLQQADLGVQTDNVLTFEVQPPESAVPQPDAPAFVDRVLAEIREVPGVVSASVDGGAPLAGSASTRAHVVGRDDGPAGAPVVLRHYVGPEHFDTLGIPVRAGRTFTDADRVGAPGAVIISESAARQLFPDGEALGQRVWFDGSTMTSPADAGEVVGIVGDVPYDNLLEERTTASIYTPYKQFTYGWRVYFVKVAAAPGPMVPAVAAAVNRVAPDLPLRNVRTLDDIVSAASAASRNAARGTSAVALLGLLLATSGIWVVVAHAMAQRTREVAIRMAHGATPRRILTMVLTDGLSWPVVGVGIGVLASLLVSSTLRNWLYAVEPGEPRLVVGSALMFIVVAALACAVPAIRATRINPNTVLRAD